MTRDADPSGPVVHDEPVPVTCVGGAELVDQLEELWLSLFDHHVSVGAGGLPVIDRAMSWPRRKALYQQLLASSNAFVVIARSASRPVGYALVHIHEGADDTWPTGSAIGEIETIAVAPDWRGQGLGTALLDEAERQLLARDVRDVKLNVINGNLDAIRLYERRGMTPVMTTYLRLGSAPAEASMAHPGR